MNSSLRRAADPVYDTILVPIDGSQLADGAMPAARALATWFGATVHTVTVAVSDLERPRTSSKAAHALGSGATSIIHTSTAPALVVPMQAVEG